MYIAAIIVILATVFAFVFLAWEQFGDHDEPVERNGSGGSYGNVGGGSDQETGEMDDK
jgi:hypothetical protein